MKKFLIILILVVPTLYFSFKYFAIKTPETEKIVDANLYDEIISIKNDFVEYRVVEIARDLFVPWSIVFTNENRILISERNGNIKEIVDGKLNKNALITFSDVSANSEEGLMGMTLHPRYSTNKYIYVCYAYEKDSRLTDKVVRLIDNGSKIVFDKIIVDNIPAAQYHAGCRIKFGPDNYLYITTGDATDKNIAQNKNSLGGKILKVKENGDEAKIYSLGHRNPQGIDWDKNGNLYSSEHGPSVFDGPAGGDELNLIVEGGNYGWPIVSHENIQDGLISPLVVWTPAIAPASLLVYKSDYFPQFKDNIFIGGLRGEGLYRVILQSNKVAKWEKMDLENFGRIRDVVQSPSGEIYFSTSNMDGRGEKKVGDDKIFKITKK